MEPDPLDPGRKLVQLFDLRELEEGYRAEGCARVVPRGADAAYFLLAISPDVRGLNTSRSNWHVKEYRREKAPDLACFPILRYGLKLEACRRGRSGTSGGLNHDDRQFWRCAYAVMIMGLAVIVSTCHMARRIASRRFLAISTASPSHSPHHASSPSLGNGTRRTTCLTVCEISARWFSCCEPGIVSQERPFDRCILPSTSVGLPAYDTKRTASGKVATTRCLNTERRSWIMALRSRFSYLCRCEGRGNGKRSVSNVRPAMSRLPSSAYSCCQVRPRLRKRALNIAANVHVGSAPGMSACRYAAACWLRPASSQALASSSHALFLS